MKYVDDGDFPREELTAFANCARNLERGVDYSDVDDVQKAYRMYMNDRWKERTITLTWNWGRNQNGDCNMVTYTIRPVNMELVQEHEPDIADAVVPYGEHKFDEIEWTRGIDGGQVPHIWTCAPIYWWTVSCVCSYT